MSLVPHGAPPVPLFAPMSTREVWRLQKRQSNQKSGSVVRSFDPGIKGSKTFSLTADTGIAVVVWYPPTEEEFVVTPFVCHVPWYEYMGPSLVVNEQTTG